MTAIAWVTGGPVRIPTVEVTPASKTPLLRIFTNEADCRESPPGQAIRGGAFISLTEHGCEKPLACGTTYAVLEGKWVPLAEDNGCERPNVLRESAVVRRLRDLCDVPYFGESENLIYVGSITNVLQTERRSCRWDAGPLVELRREDVLLSFRRGRGFLGGSRERPIRSGWNAIANFARGVDARLLPE